MRQRALLRRVALAALALGLVVPAACSDDGPGEGEARLDVDGVASVERRDGSLDEVTGGTDVGRGDRVVVTDGVARLRLRGGNTIELRAATGDADDSALEMDVVPELLAGDALVTAERDLTLAAAGTEVQLDSGAAQVNRSLGMSVATYEGVAMLDSAGQRREVRSLRQMLVPTLGRPPQNVRPIDYDAADPWDRRFLGAAMELGDRLQRLADGYTATLSPGEGRTPGFYRLILPGLEDEPDLDQLVDGQRPPGEYLIGGAISDLGVRGTFVERWQAVFGFRDQGAAWGLVAVDQGVNGLPLVDAIETAIGVSPLSFVAAPTSAPAPSAPEAPAPPTTGSPAPTTSAPPVPTTTAPPPPPVTPPPEEPELLGGVLDPVVDDVTGVVDELLGGLLGGGGSG